MGLTISEGEEGDVKILKTEGFVDTSTSSILENFLKEKIDEGKNKIVVDLSGADFISSAGWGVFVAFLRRVRPAGGDIKLAGMVNKVKQVFELMEFDSLIDAEDTAEDAVKSFRE